MALVTASYSLAIAVRPRLLAAPSRMLTPDGDVPPEVTALTRSTGTRDVLLALLLATAPTRRSVGALSIARAVADGGDAIWFARAVPRGQRWKVVGTAAVWASVELLLGLRAARRTG